METSIVAAVLCSSLGCNGKRNTPAPYASDTLPVDAIARSGEICNRLAAAGVAKNCLNATEPPPSKLHSPLFYPSSFQPVGGFPGEKCVARVFVNDEAYNSLRRGTEDTPADDYPRIEAVSTPSAMWHAGVSCAGGEADKWDKCREKKPVAACAKAFPAEYGKHKALHDAAARIVDGLK